MARKVGPTGKKEASASVPEQGGGGPKIVPAGKSAFGFTTQAEEIIQWFQGQSAGNGRWYQVFGMFPIPVEIFAADGTAVYANQALLDLVNIKEPSLLIGKYNLLKDPVCNDQIGYRKEIQQAFRGLPVICKGFPAPIQDVEERRIIKGKPFEKAMMDLYLYPTWENDKLDLVVCVFVVRNLYYGRPEVARVKEYIESHWQEDFDPDKVAGSVGMSRSQLFNLFKQHSGISPGDYYRNCKIEHIKEKLADKNLSIKEAFASCGVDSQSWISKVVFKEITGKSPKEYRKQVSNEQ